MATLGLSLAAGASMADAVYLANAAAGLVVEKRGTATIEVDELQAELAAALPEPERALAEAGS